MGQRQGHPSPMIELGSLAGLHRHLHRLAAYCLYCDRWAQLLDLAAMIVAAGHGDRRLPIEVRCRTCGELRRLQVRPLHGTDVDRARIELGRLLGPVRIEPNDTEIRLYNEQGRLEAALSRAVGSDTTASFCGSGGRIPDIPATG